MIQTISRTISFRMRRRRNSIFGVCFLLAQVYFLPQSLARASGQTPLSAPFAPLEAWRLAVLSGDSPSLKKLYSASPEPHIADLQDKTQTLSDELASWTGWKAKGLSGVQLEIVQEQDPKPDLHVIVLRVALSLQEGAVSKREYIVLVQGW